MRGFKIQQCRNHLNLSSLKITQRTQGLQSTSLPPLVLEASQRISESTWRTCRVLSCNNRSKLRNQNLDHHLDPTVLVPSLNLNRNHHLLLARMKATERRGSEEDDLEEAISCLLSLPDYLKLELNEQIIWFCSCISTCS